MFGIGLRFLNEGTVSRLRAFDLATCDLPDYSSRQTFDRRNKF
jgi:hypothetical protein